MHILALTTCSGHLAAGADTIKGVNSSERKGPLNYLMCFRLVLYEGHIEILGEKQKLL